MAQGIGSLSFSDPFPTDYLLNLSGTDYAQEPPTTEPAFQSGRLVASDYSARPNFGTSLGGLGENMPATSQAWKGPLSLPKPAVTRQSLENRAAGTNETSGTPARKPEGEGETTVNVEQHETLWELSHRYGVSVEDLATRNGLERSQNGGYKLEAGSKLIVPDGKVAGVDWPQGQKWNDKNIEKFVSDHHAGTVADFRRANQHIFNQGGPTKDQKLWVPTPKSEPPSKPAEPPKTGTGSPDEPERNSSTASREASRGPVPMARLYGDSSLNILNVGTAASSLRQATKAGDGSQIPSKPTVRTPVTFGAGTDTTAANPLKFDREGGDNISLIPHTNVGTLAEVQITAGE